MHSYLFDIRRDNVRVELKWVAVAVKVEPFFGGGKDEK